MSADLFWYIHGDGLGQFGRRDRVFCVWIVERIGEGKWYPGQFSKHPRCMNCLVKSKWLHIVAVNARALAKLKKRARLPVLTVEHVLFASNKTMQFAYPVRHPKSRHSPQPFMLQTSPDVKAMGAIFFHDIAHHFVLGMCLVYIKLSCDLR